VETRNEWDGEEERKQLENSLNKKQREKSK
jgi:hypothetical protein